MTCSGLGASGADSLYGDGVVELEDASEDEQFELMSVIRDETVVLSETILYIVLVEFD